MSSFYEERRADRAAEREQDRLDRREQAEQKRRDEQTKQRLAERRKADARERRAEQLAKLTDEGDTAAALIVMACALIPAYYFQVKALLAAGLPWPIAVALATMLESAAWVATVAGERAKKHGRPTAVFRAAMWSCAALAGTINYSHAPDSDGGWLAWVLAAASIAPVGIWELRGRGRHDSKGSRTKQQRAEDRAKRRHERKRRKEKEVWARYEQILTAHPYGTVDRERAWADAWGDVEGAPLGLTAAVLKRRQDATRAVEQAIADAGHTPESLAVDALLRDLFGAPRRGDEGEGGTPLRGPSGTPSGGDSEGATPLGRKGKRGFGRTSAKTPKKPVAEADLEKVRKFADALGDTSKLSARNVREVLGGGANEYIIRVRDAVKKERENQ